MRNNQFYWQRTKEGGARLLRVFGTSSKVILPNEIEGYPLAELGAYCFAENAHLPDAYDKTAASGFSNSIELRQICGSYVKRIVLPDTLLKIGNLAFYNCTSLEQIELGRFMEETGSDAFMNCRSFQNITLRCGITEKSGLRPILSQISSDMEVTFLGKDGIEAILLFPEYYESYDEIAPAHLFGRNIEGEGFRARQAFKDGIVDLAQYDSIFPKACAEETVQTLSRLSLNRLRFPAALTPACRSLYETYIRQNPFWLCKSLVFTRDIQGLGFLCQNRLLSTDALHTCIQYAVETGWAEGSAFLLHQKQTHDQEIGTSRYTFEDF